MLRFICAHWGNWKVRLSVCIAGLMALASGALAMNEIWDNWVSFGEKAHTLWSLLATPWIGALALGLIAALFLTGVRDVKVALAKGDDKTKEALKIPNEIIQAFFGNHREQVASMALAQVEGQLERYREAIRKMEQVQPFPMRYHDPLGDALQSASTIVRTAASSVAVTSPHVDLKRPQYETRPDQTPMSMGQTFDPAWPQNKIYIDEHKHNLKQLRDMAHLAKNGLETLSRENKARNEAIFERLK